MAVHHIPKGYAPLTPYLIVDDGAAALEYYKKVFGAIELMRMPMSEGKLGHAEFTIDGCRVMMADEFPDLGAVSPKTVGGTPVSLSLYVQNCDEVFARAIEAGGTPIRPPEDQFYGDRAGVLKDPFGHQWTVATHVEDVSAEEMERRLAAMDAATGEPC